MMKKKVMVLLCICISLAVSACSKGKEIAEEGPYVYYVDSEGMSLVKASYKSQKGDVSEQVGMLLNTLETPEKKGEYSSPIPSGVKVLQYKVNENKVEVHFNSAYGKLAREAEILCRAAVVQSVLQISGVSSVSFYVEGAALTDKRGVPFGEMRAEDFVQNIGPALNSYQKATLTLYYSNSEGDKLKEGTVNIRYNSNILMEKLIVEQLMKGASTNGGKSAIPKETKLLGVSVKDGICYVNFDEGFVAHGYEGDPKITIYSIVNSLIECGTVNQVQISVNGETNLSFHGMIDLSKPFTKDFSMLKEEQ